MHASGRAGRCGARCARTCAHSPCAPGWPCAARGDARTGTLSSEGSQLTGSKIGERLHAEAATSVSLRVLPAGAGGEAFEVQARGELQLGLLIGARRPLCMRSNAPPSPPASLPRGELKFGLHIGARRPPADAQLPSPGPPWRGVLRYRRAASCTPAFSYTAAPPSFGAPLRS